VAAADRARTVESAGEPIVTKSTALAVAAAAIGVTGASASSMIEPAEAVARA